MFLNVMNFMNVTFINGFTHPLPPPIFISLMANICLCSDNRIEIVIFGM